MLLAAAEMKAVLLRAFGDESCLHLETNVSELIVRLVWKMR